MRTACFSYRLDGEVCPGGVSAQGGVCPGGGCLLRGYLPSGGVHYPPVNIMTDRCKSITLPQTSFAGGNKETEAKSTKT